MTHSSICPLARLALPLCAALVLVSAGCGEVVEQQPTDAGAPDSAAPPDTAPEPDAPGCPDSDGDTVCDLDDVCDGFDDGADLDGDSVPDGCDRCPGEDDTIDADGDGTPDCAVFQFGFSDEFPDNSSHSQDFLLGSAIAVDRDVTLTALAVIGKQAGPNFRLALYTDAGDRPDQLIASTAPTALAVGVQELPVAQVLLPAGTYWFMGIYEQGASIGIQFGNANAVVRHISLAFANPLPETWPANDDSYTGQEFNYYIVAETP